MVLFLSPRLKVCELGLNANFMDISGVDNFSSNEYLPIVGGTGLIIPFTAVRITSLEEQRQETKFRTLHWKLL